MSPPSGNADEWAHCFDGSLAKRHVNTTTCADPRPRRDCPFCGSGLGEHDHLLTGGSEGGSSDPTNS